MMNNIKYLKYLLKHKYYATKYCFKFGLYWRGLVHDLSKFLPSEWIAYREYFYNNPYNRKCVEADFNYAWLFHQHRNRHHWQYWCLKEDSGAIFAMEMPYVYIQEMVADWIAAGIAIAGKLEVKEWYNKNRDNMILGDITRYWVELLIDEVVYEDKNVICD